MKKPRKIIIKNPDELWPARFDIDKLIDDAITARENMSRKDGGYTMLGKGCHVLTPKSTCVEYDNGVTATTYFNRGVLTINLRK